MHEVRRARGAEPLRGIVVENLFVDRTFAPDANTVRPFFETTQRGTQLVENKIALESEHCIELVYGEAAVIEDLFGPIETVVLLQVLEQLGQNCPPH